MSNQDARTPRVFLVRHGETEWAKFGRYTSTTDVELTAKGALQVSSAAPIPRKRAIKTFELLMQSPPSTTAECEVTYTEDIAEWNYGDFEGLMEWEIKSLIKTKGLLQGREWNIWGDGCEGGESMQQVTERLDRLISQIRLIQKPYMNGEKPADVLLVAHGLILRCFLKRWLGLSLDFPLEMMLAPGAIGVLSYKKNNISIPAFHAGIALPFPDEN
ncbi:histidine phosphatase superfamily [Corynascus novoguineensis]|uniref:Histidine phosphatase superfamily n=1 Tax=Corynascus novoguineensis TaxID=1126955 RepID=A0AAN7CK32_9PEZI|nr:histidine phosphatase superfamily [Corynascus novoguineensis]